MGEVIFSPTNYELLLQTSLNNEGSNYQISVQVSEAHKTNSGIVLCNFSWLTHRVELIFMHNDKLGVLNILLL